MNIPDVSLVSTKSQLLSEESVIFLTFLGELKIKKQLSRVLPKGEVDSLMKYMEKRRFSGKAKETLFLPIFDDTMAVIVGLGEESKDLDLETYRRSVNKGIELLKQLRIESGAIVPPQTKNLTPKEVAEAITEGVVLGSYEFDKYKSKPEDEKDVLELKRITIALDSVTKAVEAGVERATTICEGTLMARDLANEISDNVDPATFAAEVQKLAKTSTKLTTKIITGEELKKKNLNMIHAVGRGSAVPPRLIILEYKGRPAKKHDVALVGKGITFDTGGLNLKPSSPMTNQMHIDMGGAATVLATISVADKLKLKKNILGVMALAENAVDAKSYKPGSIIRSHAGKTVEVANTDAEGRLVLGDALSYATTEYQPEYVIDLATLTGAILVALGFQAAGLYTNDNTLRTKLFDSAKKTGERIWELPLYPEYKEDIKSVYADIKNMGSGAGAQSAAAATFLEEFINGAKWAHLDIAGTAILDKRQDYMPANGTGYGVRLLVDYLS